eukprot:g3064.t1
MNLGVKHEIVTPHPANQRNRHHHEKARQEREWQHERDHAVFGVDAVSPRTEDGKERPKPSPAPSLSPSPRPMPREPPNGGSPCLHGTSSPGGERSRSPRSGTPSNMRPRSGSPTSDMLGKRAGAEDFFSSDRTIQSAATAASGRGESGASSSSPAQEQPASSSSAATSSTARSGAGVAAPQEPAEPASNYYASPRTVPHHWGRNSPPRGKVALVPRVPSVLFEFGSKPEKDNPEGKIFDANKTRSAGAQSPRETGQTGSACMTVPLPIPHGGGQAHVPEVQGMAACLQSSRVMPFPLSPALPNKSPDEVGATEVAPAGAAAGASSPLSGTGTSGPSSLHQHGQGARVLISANTTGESFRSRTKTDAGATSTQRRSSPNSAGGTASRSHSPRSAPAFERIEEYFKTVVGDYGTSAYGKPTSSYTGHQHKHNKDHRSGSDADVEFPRARSDCFRLEPMLNANDAAAPPTGQLMSTSAANKFKSVVVTTGLAAPGPGGGVEAPSGADPSQPLLPATTSGRLFGNQQMTSRRHHVSGHHNGAPSSHGSSAGNSTTSKLNLQSLSPSRSVPVKAVKLACITGISNVNDKRTPTTNLPPQDNDSRFVREKWQLPPRRSLEPHQIAHRFESALAAENASLELFRHQEAKKLKAEREREAKKQKDRVNAKVSFQRVLEQREREDEKQRLAFEKQRLEKKELLARANSEVEQEMLHAGDHLRGRRAGGMDPKKILEDALEFVDNECLVFDARSTGAVLPPKNKTKTNGTLAQSSREKTQPSGAVTSSIAEEGHGEHQGQAGMAASSEHDLQPSSKKMRPLNKSVSFAMEDVEEISRRGDLTTGEISSEDQDRLFIHHSEFGLDDGESTEQDLAVSSLAQEMFGASASNWQTVELDAKDRLFTVPNGFGPVPAFGGEFDDFFNGRASGRAFPDEFQFNDEFGFFPPPPGGDADGPPQQDENNSLDLDSSSSAGAVGTPLSSDRGRPGSRTDQRSGPRRSTQKETPQDTSNSSLSVVDRLVAKAYRKAQGLATPADKDKKANGLHVKGRLVEGLVEAGEVTRVQDHYVVFQQPSLRRAANHVAELQLHQRGSGGAPHVNDHNALQLAQPSSLQGNAKVAAGAAPPTFKNAATAELIHGPHEPTLKQRLNLTTNESFLGEIQRAPVNPYSSRSRTTWNRVEWPPMGHRGARGPALPPVFGRDPMFLHPCARDEASTLAHSREAVGFMDDIAVARRDTHVHPNNQLLHPARRAALMSAPQSVAHVTKYGSILPEFATGEQIRYMTKRPPYLRMSEMTAGGGGTTWSEDRIDRLSITWSPGDFPQIFYPGEESDENGEPHQTQQSVDEDVAGSLFDYDFVNNQAGVLFADACTTMAVSKFFNPTAAALKQTPGGGLKLSQKTIEEERAERTPPSRISQLHFYPEESDAEHFAEVDVEKTSDAQQVEAKQSSTCCVLQKNLHLFYHGEPDGREMNKTRSQHNRVHAEHSRASAGNTGLEAPANKISTNSVHFENSLLQSFLHPNHLTRNLPLKSFRNLKPEVVFDHYGLRPDLTLSAISEVAMTNRGARKLHLEHRRDATAAMKKVLHPFPVLRLSELKRRDEALRRRELNEFDLTKELLQNAGPDGGSIPMEAIPLGALVGATAHMREVERQRREEEEAEEEARRARAAKELGVEMDGLEMEGTKDLEEDADGAPGRTDDPIPNAFDAAAEDIAAKQAAYESFKEQARPTRKPLPTKHHPIVSLRPINPKRSHLWHTEPKRDNAKLADAYLPQQGTNPMQTTNSSWHSGGSWSSREGQHSPRIHLASPEMSIAQRSDRGFTPVAQDHDPSLRSLVDEDERSLASVPPFVFPPYADLSDDRRARVLALLQERKMRARARGILARQRAEGNLRELEALAAARRLSLLQGLGYFDSLSADDRAALFKQAQKQLSGEKMKMERDEKNKQTAGANKSKFKSPKERLKTYVKALQIAVQRDPEMVNYKAIDFGKEYFDSKSASDVWWLFPAHSAFAKKFNSHMDRLSNLFLRESAERGGSELFRVGAQRGAPGGAGSSTRSSPSGSGRASPAAAVHPTIYEHESTHGGGSSPSSSRHGGMLSPTARKTRAQLIEAVQNPNESFDLFKNRASCAELGQTISALIRELSTDDEIELIGPMTLAFPISQVAHKMRFLEKLQALAEHIRLRAKKQKIIDLRILSLLLKLCNTRLILHLDHLTAGTALMRKDAVKVPGEMLRRKATQLVAMALTQTQEQLLKAEQAEEEVLGAMEHWEKAAKAMGLTIPGGTPSMAQVVEEARAAAQLEQEDELGAPDPTLFGAFDEQMLLATPSPTKSKKEELLTGKSPAGRHAVSFIAKSARSGSFSELSRGGSMEFSRGGSIEFANVVEASSPSQTTGSTPKEVAFEDEGRAGSPAQHQGSTAPGSLPPLSSSSPRPAVSSSPKVVKQMKHAHTVQVLPNELRPGSKEQLKEERQQAALAGTSAAVAGAPHPKMRRAKTSVMPISTEEDVPPIDEEKYVRDAAIQNIRFGLEQVASPVTKHKVTPVVGAAAVALKTHEGAVATSSSPSAPTGASSPSVRAAALSRKSSFATGSGGQTSQQQTPSLAASSSPGGYNFKATALPRTKEGLQTKMSQLQQGEEQDTPLYHPVSFLIRKLGLECASSAMKTQDLEILCSDDPEQMGFLDKNPTGVSLTPYMLSLLTELNKEARKLKDMKALHAGGGKKIWKETSNIMADPQMQNFGIGDFRFTMEESSTNALANLSLEVQLKKDFLLADIMDKDWKVKVDEVFALLDTDYSGYVMRSDMQEWYSQALIKQQKEKNAYDGTVTISKQVQAIFDDIDSNGDGLISYDEWVLYFANLVKNGGISQTQLMMELDWFVKAGGHGTVGLFAKPN